jgi:hypothetical protein
VKLTRQEFVERLIWSGFEFGMMWTFQHLERENIISDRHGGWRGIRAEILSAPVLPVAFGCAMGFVPPRPLSNLALAIEPFWRQYAFLEQLLGDPSAIVPLEITGG